MHDGAVGLIGSGAILALAERLLACGVDLLVWDRDADGCEDLAELGAEPVIALDEFMERCDIVLLCVDDAVAMDEFVLGVEGMAAFAAEEQILVDLAHTAPTATRRLAHELAQRSGMAWVDAPLLGDFGGAGDDSPSSVVGGAETDVAHVLPLLESLCSRVTYVGEVGAGQAARLCHAMLTGSTTLAIAETIAWAERNGVETERLPAALENTAADSPLLQCIGARMAVRESEPASLRIAALRGELEQALECARESGATLPMIALMTQLLYQHGLRTSADEDLATLIELYSA